MKIPPLLSDVFVYIRAWPSSEFRAVYIRWMCGTEFRAKDYIKSVLKFGGGGGFQLFFPYYIKYQWMIINTYVIFTDRMQRNQEKYGYVE